MCEPEATWLKLKVATRSIGLAHLQSDDVSIDIVEHREKAMVPSLADAVTIFSKWKEDSAEVLVVSESPFQQSRRGVIEQRVDWSLGMQGKITEATIDASVKGSKSARVVLATTSGNLSLNIGICAFVYEEPREAKPDIRAEAVSATISALSVFFPSNEVFVFYELREPIKEGSLFGWSTI